jgi:hypothetical protein
MLVFKDWFTFFKARCSIMNLVTSRATDNHVTKFKIVRDMILLSLCCLALVRLKRSKDAGPQRWAC